MCNRYYRYFVLIHILTKVFVTTGSCSISGLANGQVSPSPSSPVGKTVEYFCNQGYVLEGVDKRRCQSDGTLSGLKPSCRRGMNLYVLILDMFY